MMLTKMINIGKSLATALEDVGIHTSEDLIQIGSVEALLKLGVTGPTCANKLYALEGAILNIRWHDLSSTHRQVLLEDYKRKLNEVNIRDKK